MNISISFSLCNTKATSYHSLLSHANGKQHRENVEWFDAKQQQSEQSMVNKKDTIENASKGDTEQKKVDLHVPSGVANGYPQADKKRKLETSDETWNRDVVRDEEAKGGSEEKRESKKAKKQELEKKGKKDKKQEHEKKRTKDKKQTESDSDFEYEKEDVKLLLVPYSKEEPVNLVYKTAEKGSRLISAILESAEHEIALLIF